MIRAKNEQEISHRRYKFYCGLSLSHATCHYPCEWCGKDHEPTKGCSGVLYHTIANYRQGAEKKESSKKQAK